MSEILGLHHIQLAMPAGQEDVARAFYTGVLGLTEEAKPAHLLARGGVWLRGGALRLHLGVEPEFRAARKAHPAFLVRGLAELAARCSVAGFPPVEDEPLEGFDRLYVFDPFGNRIELLEPRSGHADQVPTSNFAGRAMPKTLVNPPSLFSSVEHGFSQVVIASGAKTVFISGQVAWDATKRIVGRNCGEQARQALHNVQAAVEAAGGTLRDIVSIRIYVVDLAENVEAVGRVLREAFATEPPTSTWIGVSALAAPDFLIEIEATAVLE